MGLPNIGPGELILILIIALVVLGPGKLPDVASSLGRSVREFRKAATDVNDAGRLDAPASTPSQATPPAAPADQLASAGTSASTPEVAAGEPTPAAGSPARDPNLS